MKVIRTWMFLALACGPKPTHPTTPDNDLDLARGGGSGSEAIGSAAPSEEEETEPTTRSSHCTHPAHGSGACAASLDECPARGCEPDGSPHALANQVKRTAGSITFASSISIDFNTMRELQREADGFFEQGCEIADRSKLASLDIYGGKLGEGMPVRIAGHLAPHVSSRAASGVHEGSIESVNCRLSKVTERDIHISLMPAADASECDGVVVEMAPQGRGSHPSWNDSELRKIKPDVLVMVVGQLFYDNEHLVNADCSHLVTGQPRRASLWEVHPITELYKCDASTCSVDSLAGWTKVD